MHSFAACSGIPSSHCSSKAAVLAAILGLCGLGWEQAFQCLAAVGEYRPFYLPVGNFSFIYLVGKASPDSHRADGGFVFTLALHRPSR